ncbi:hypothetical protein H4R23_006207, partial [Coemansia sp. Cherry 401B]
GLAGAECAGDQLPAAAGLSGRDRSCVAVHATPRADVPQGRDAQFSHHYRGQRGLYSAADRRHCRADLRWAQRLGDDGSPGGVHGAGVHC